MSHGEDLPYEVIAVDVGGTSTRVAVVAADGSLASSVIRFATPSPRNSPQRGYKLRDRLFDQLATQIRALRSQRQGKPLKALGVSFGAVVTNQGVVENASVLWHETAKGFNIIDALRRRIDDISIFVVNDVSAAAWRHRCEGRYLLVTVSTGVAGKVFDARLATPYHLELDEAGLGGEMGHIVVDPMAAANAVAEGRNAAVMPGSGFKGSKLEALTNGDPAAIDAGKLGEAALAGDRFAIGILERTDTPFCECGNLADLCSYSSGPATVRMIQVLARSEPEAFSRSAVYKLCDHGASPIDTFVLSRAAMQGDEFAQRVLHRATRFLALRILQLCADLGLDKVRVTGGFANGLGKSYFDALHCNLMSFAHNSGFFTSWGEEDFRRLIRPCPDHENDALIGVGLIAYERALWYRAACKASQKSKVEIRLRRREPCGAGQVTARILYAGICSTDLQIYRGERDYEPVVLGHECVAVAVETGSRVTGLKPGDVFAINPNNPLDDFEKIGHTREGCFQEWFTFHSDLISKCQIVRLGREARPEWVLLELLACVLHFQEHMGDWRDQKALIVGAGIAGMLHAEMARLRGARKVVLANRSPGKLAMAVSRGVLDANDALTFDQARGWAEDHGGLDRIVIALAGNAGAEVLPWLLPCGSSGAVVGLFGGFPAGPPVTVDDTQIDCNRIRRERRRVSISMPNGRTVVCTGSRGSTFEDYKNAYELVATGKFDLGRFISRLVPLPELPSAIEELARNGSIGGQPAIRVVVDMTKDLNETALPKFNS